MRYDKGPLGALMDEYERAAMEYIEPVRSIPPQSFNTILDPFAADQFCQSVQGITAHVIGAGYGYANGIRHAFGKSIESAGQYYPNPSSYPSQQEFANAMKAMLEYTERTLDGLWSMTDEEVNEKMIPMGWKDRYDLETLLEHAIVHILRHRRQVQRLISSSNVLPPNPPGLAGR